MTAVIRYTFNDDSGNMLHQNLTLTPTLTLALTLTPFSTMAAVIRYILMVTVAIHYTCNDDSSNRLHLTIHYILIVTAVIRYTFNDDSGNTLHLLMAAHSHFTASVYLPANTPLRMQQPTVQYI